MWCVKQVPVTKGWRTLTSLPYFLVYCWYFAIIASAAATFLPTNKTVHSISEYFPPRDLRSKGGKGNSDMGKRRWFLKGRGREGRWLLLHFLSLWYREEEMAPLALFPPPLYWTRFWLGAAAAAAHGRINLQMSSVRSQDVFFLLTPWPTRSKRGGGCCCWHCLLVLLYSFCCSCCCFSSDIFLRHAANIWPKFVLVSTLERRKWEGEAREGMNEVTAQLSSVYTGDVVRSLGEITGFAAVATDVDRSTLD